MKLSPNKKSELKKKYGEWAVVTGASSGIGLELAIQLADAGFNLIMNARDEAKLKRAEELLTSKNTRIIVVAADISEQAGIKKLIASADGLNVGLLINNAGYGTSGPFANSALASEINMLRLNCEAVLTLTHHFIGRFRQQKRGGIIFLSSLVALQGVPYAANYAATKAYIRSFAESLAVELKPYRIDVLAAAPGPVDSGFGDRAGMKMNMAVQPDEIGAEILNALGSKTTVVPGSLSKILTFALHTVPRYFKIRIMGKIMKGFTGN